VSAASINGARAAFPITPEDEKNGSGNSWGSPGLTKREHFAGLAMQAIIAGDVDKCCSVEAAGSVAVRFADALLEELEK
jgi:hypothetical protein